jgi:plastocyanin
MRSLLVLAAAAVIVSCGSDTEPIANKTYDIFMIGDAFSPFSQTVAPNDTILWHFAPGSDQQGHNVRFSPRITGSPADLPVQKSGTATSVFTTKGDFKYVCDVHPGMIGEIVVQ